MEKVLIAADEVEKWKHLYEGLKHKWVCTMVDFEVFEKFHAIAVYDAVLMLLRKDNGLLGIYPHSVAVARYAALIQIKSPTNWDSQLTKSLFQTRSRAVI